MCCCNCWLDIKGFQLCTSLDLWDESHRVKPRVLAGPILACFWCEINFPYNSAWLCKKHTFLGLLAKIKCSICSLEFDNSNRGHCPRCYLTYFSGGFPNSGACTAGLAAWPLHCTTALAEHPLQIKIYSTYSFVKFPIRSPSSLNFCPVIMCSITCCS